MKRLFILLAFVSVLAVSCTVDRDYDLNKPLNTHMILLKNFNIPLGNVGDIPANSLLFLAGLEYLSFDEEGHMVLDFSENPEFVFQFDIKGLNVNVAYELDRAFGFILDMDISNTSPFAFDVDVSFLDKEANVIPTFHSLINGSVIPGTPTSPSDSHVMLDISAEKVVPFDGLRFSFRFSGGIMDGKRVVVTDDEFISFHTLRVNLPEGLPFDIDWLNTIKPYWNIVNLIIELFKD